MRLWFFCFLITFAFSFVEGKIDGRGWGRRGRKEILTSCKRNLLPGVECLMTACQRDSYFNLPTTIYNLRIISHNLAFVFRYSTCISSMLRLNELNSFCQLGN